jgi:hypothetical protein
VTREDLRSKLWPRTTVDFDHGLNKAISKIRETLGDSVENPRFVETVARRGYRFLADVAVVDTPERQFEAAPDGLAGPRATALVASTDAGTSSKRALRPYAWWLFAFGLVLALTASLSWILYSRIQSSPMIRSLAVCRWKTSLAMLRRITSRMG